MNLRPQLDLEDSGRKRTAWLYVRQRGQLSAESSGIASLHGLDWALVSLHTLAENKANTLGKPIENPVFPEGIDDSGRRPRPFSDLRWSHFKHFGSADMYEVVSQSVFPFIQGMGEAGSSFAANMKDARFTIPTPALLVKVVELLEDIPMQDRDTKGDVYEYMLSKLATSGQNGQFRTPRHLIQLMVDMAAPTPQDVIVAGEYVREHHPELWADAALRQHFDRTMRKPPSPRSP